jgi:hypothetical protein
MSKTQVLVETVSTAGMVVPTTAISVANAMAAWVTLPGSRELQNRGSARD